MNRICILFLLFFSIGQISAVNLIVAKDGSGDFTTIQAAVDACPDGSRSFIFVKNGTYYGQTFIGTKAAPGTKYISLIGENRDSVIITYDVACSTTVTYEQSCTFQIYAKNFYAENVSFVNSAGNTGQALALYTAGDMSILKNCKLLGYQDTYRSKKGTRTYLLNCWVEGAVDFIYAGGTLIFDDCTIYCIREGGFISAPEDCYQTIPKASTAAGIFLRLGFVFNNCVIKGPSSVRANTFYLGRPWGDYAGTAYLNCKMSDQVSTAGWATMGSSTYLTSCFGEYNSMDLNGNALDISKRISWSFQFLKADVDTHLNPTAFYAKGYSAIFDPFTLSKVPGTPINLKLENGILSWDAVADAAGYMIFKNKKLFAFSSANQYYGNGLSGSFEVVALNTIGVMSNLSTAVTGIRDNRDNRREYTLHDGFLTLDESTERIEMFDISGKCLQVIENQNQISLKSIHSEIVLLKIRYAGGDIQSIRLKI